MVLLRDRHQSQRSREVVEAPERGSEGRSVKGKLEVVTVTCVECLKRFEMDAQKYEKLRLIDGVLYPAAKLPHLLVFCSTKCGELWLIRNRSLPLHLQ